MYIINENKDNIFKKYDGLKLDPIKLTSDLKLTRKNVNKEKWETREFENELDIIIILIELIIRC